ncbi:MAG TPA: His-Xaa-Ser system radical SAM maturase HxsB [Deltaproteobacteria bacterium]|nr:His-Xaa-Ser system radical SAM maturase HxsB [Deltaproteobacteria bacterium]
MRTTVTARALPVVPEALGFFRWARIGDRVLLTNDAGEFSFLSEPDFRAFLSDTLSPDHPQRATLQRQGFLRRGLDVNGLAQRIRRKRAFLGNGPHLHAVITTLRCNQSCRYCHASRADLSRIETDMSLATAKSVVDFAMQTPSRHLNFEFQGGEPTINFDVIKFIVEYSREKNRHEGKELVHSVVTNLTAMDEGKAEWLIANDVLVCTSLDGPEDLHNWNRLWAGRGAGNAWSEVMKWIAYFNRRYVELGRDPDLWHVDALMTVTSKTLPRWRECVELYLQLGIRSIHFRPLNPFGFARKTWQTIGYTPQAFSATYEALLDHVIELNLAGEQIIEGTAATFLKKILTPDDPNFVDIRSPVGSGTGQLAYAHDGTIYPSDEGRMIAAMGDDLFAIGHVERSSFEEIVQHPTVRAIAVASLLDSLPGCSDCYNAPYCGVRPLHNYMHSGDLFGQRPNTPKCQEHMAISRALFSRLAADADGSLEGIFRRWVIERPRSRDTQPPQTR